MNTAVTQLDSLISSLEAKSNDTTQPTNNTDEQKHNKTINRIAIVYAMYDEAKPLISQLKLTQNPSYSSLLSPFTIYTNDVNTIFLSCNGKCPSFKCDRIGTQWAAMCALLILKHIKPDVMINAGTCGGIVPKYAFADDFSKGNYTSWPNVEIADVFIGKNVIYSDRRVPLPQWQPWDIGNYNLFASEYLSNKLKIPTAAIATSNAFDYTEFDRQLYKKHKVVCKEMECAAIAEICCEYDTKLIALKGVTDIVEHHDGEHFLANLNKTVSSITNQAEKVIDAIMGENIQTIGR